MPYPEKEKDVALVVPERPIVANEKRKRRERVVYTHKGHHPGSDKPSRRVRYPSADGPVEWCMVGNLWFVSTNGSPRRQYLNVEPPDNATHSPACIVCNYAYSELAHTDACGCSECRNDAAFAMAYDLERAGIPLGWGYTGKDSNTMRAEYRYEYAILAGWRENDVSKIDQRRGVRRIRIDPRGQ